MQLQLLADRCDLGKKYVTTSIWNATQASNFVQMWSFFIVFIRSNVMRSESSKQGPFLGVGCLLTFHRVKQNDFLNKN